MKSQGRKSKKLHFLFHQSKFYTYIYSSTTSCIFMRLLVFHPAPSLENRIPPRTILYKLLYAMCKDRFAHTKKGRMFPEVTHLSFRQSCCRLQIPVSLSTTLLLTSHHSFESFHRLRIYDGKGKYFGWRTRKTL